MFFRNTVKTVAVSVALLAFGAQAKTFKYELQDLHSSNAEIQYPGLDLNDASSVILTIDQADHSEPAILTSLEINFPYAPSLSVSNFREDDQDLRFYATVDDAWVYRQLDITIDGLDIESPNNTMVHIEGFVSETENFIGEESSLNFDQRLFTADGKLVDATPSNIVDVKSFTVDGSQVELSLRDNPTVDPDSENGDMAFVVELLWFGEGKEVFYFHAPFGDESKFFEAYKLEVSTMSGPDGDETAISILAKDMQDNESETHHIYLEDMLRDAYDL
ncbi:hypothetical protein BTJ40_04210 [Microbulbifer sp. A4B17]|uniref:hypothetical protein n=1 Tax=Microbulbifer sp. A4B17 TaxID=359370 RepID=UPI000D52DE78|nr:hypothetical protein [Microbulbifer sp. A4B17]AWF80084.1 hypothetical protein BTJ40_04210 [Microbulbifer sp. A4B17]